MWYAVHSQKMVWKPTEKNETCVTKNVNAALKFMANIEMTNTSVFIGFLKVPRNASTERYQRKNGIGIARKRNSKLQYCQQKHMFLFN